MTSPPIKGTRFLSVITPCEVEIIAIPNLLRLGWIYRCRQTRKPGLEIFFGPRNNTFAFFTVFKD